MDQKGSLKWEGFRYPATLYAGVKSEQNTDYEPGDGFSDKSCMGGTSTA